jgi:hypothetical protein
MLGYYWWRVRSFFSTYKARYGQKFGKFYLAGLVSVTAGLIIFTLMLGVINPHVSLPYVQGGAPTALMREWENLVARDRRGQARLNDFTIMVQRMSDNFPFFEAAQPYMGMNYMELAIYAFNKLFEAGAADLTVREFSEFLYVNFLSQLGGFGGAHITAEPRYARIPWIHQPYFFGHYDWRFTDDSITLEVREDNITVAIYDNEKHIRVESFIAKGYEPITRHPFWYYCRDAEQARWAAIFADLHEIDEIVIDIRGINAGFGGYFVPFILEPLLRGEINERFYAFHTEAAFAMLVSERLRGWYGWGEAAAAYTLTAEFDHPIPAHLTMGFGMEFNLVPGGALNNAADFDGRITLLIDSANASGANKMYLLLARAAGFEIIYEHNAEAAKWPLASLLLPNSGLSLRFNPLYFTNFRGKILESVTF